MLVRADVAGGTLAILDPTGVPDYGWELMLVYRAAASGDDRIVATVAHARHLLAPVASAG
jgi:hypothetical protein